MGHRLNPKTLLAATIAPLIGCAATAGVHMISRLLFAGDASAQDIRTNALAIFMLLIFFVIPAMIFYAAVGLLASWTLGVPAHAALSQIGMRHPLIYVLTWSLGGIIAALPLIFGLVPFPNGTWVTPEQIRGVAGIAFVMGAITGVVFWLIRRPDRDAPNPARSTP